MERRAKKTKGGEGKKVVACSRILIVACQMRFSGSHSTVVEKRKYGRMNWWWSTCIYIL
jgi:hypothetical protein